MNTDDARVRVSSSRSSSNGVWLCALLAALASNCGSRSGASQGTDSGVDSDASPNDANAGDASPGDANADDASPNDANADDASPNDANADDASPNDASPDDGGSVEIECYARVTPAPEAIEDPLGVLVTPSFVWTDAGAVGVGPSMDGMGYRILPLDRDGKVSGPGDLVWEDVQPVTELVLTASDRSIGIFEQAWDDVGRQYCRFGVYDLSAQAPARSPSRYSDPTNVDDIEGEVTWCSGVATRDGFVGLWLQFTSATSDAQSLFAQGFDESGQPSGVRIEVSAGDKSAQPLAVGSDAEGVVLAVAGRDGGEVGLVFIEQGALRRVSLDERIGAAGPSVRSLRPAHGAWLVSTGEQLALVDDEGRLLAGPVAEESSLAAPLEDGFVVVTHEQFLSAHTRDATLAAPSPPSGVSWDRRAHGSQLLVAGDGGAAALIYGEQGRLRYASLGCGDAPGALGPPPCPELGEVAPLDVCDEEVCHVVVRLDAMTLGVKGWAVASGPSNPVDAAGAQASAQVAFDAAGAELFGAPSMSGPEAALYTAYVEPGDFGGFALVGADSGLVVAAGGIVWSGRGTYWQPTDWRDPALLACGEARFDATSDSASTTECDAEATLPSAGDALELALRTNLAAQLAGSGEFAAHSYLYTPTVGECDVGVAEYLVVLSQRE